MQTLLAVGLVTALPAICIVLMVYVNRKSDDKFTEKMESGVGDDQSDH